MTENGSLPQVGPQAVHPGPVTVSDQTLTVSGNSASLTVPWTDSGDGYTVTLLPPSNTTISTVAVAQHSGQCLDVSGASTADGAAVIQYTCNGATNQMFTLTPSARSRAR
ncbi:RICIN domain-containing protein [Streptomyces sp. NPDC007991]|uniref:RICIN domain-containing protein n=1 Tax=Streptomyces sp. NPDC007991 TaxID=3364803 RepID=UPI0036EE3AA5